MVLDPRVTLFQEFKKDHGRTYTGEEEVRRFGNFKAALEISDSLGTAGFAGGPWAHREQVVLDIAALEEWEAKRR